MGLDFRFSYFFFKKDSKAEHQPAVCAVQKAELRVKIQRENYFILSSKTYEKTAFVLVG